MKVNQYKQRNKYGTRTRTSGRRGGSLGLGTAGYTRTERTNLHIRKGSNKRQCVPRARFVLNQQKQGNWNATVAQTVGVHVVCWIGIRDV